MMEMPYLDPPCVLGPNSWRAQYLGRKTHQLSVLSTLLPKGPAKSPFTKPTFNCAIYADTIVESSPGIQAGNLTQKSGCLQHLPTLPFTIEYDDLNIADSCSMQEVLKNGPTL